MKKRFLRRRLDLLFTVALCKMALVDVNAAVTVIGFQYQQDELFPEYNCIWHDKDYPANCPGTYLGGNVHVYLKNTGVSAITINDATLAGYSLETVIKLDPSGQQHEARSVHYYWDNPPADIVAAGLPVWYKGDPRTIPAGGVGQCVIRLRYPPATPTVSVGVVTSGGTVTTNIPISSTAPQLASVGFSQDRSKVYLHWRRDGGAAPTAVRMDGNDVTAITTTVGDPTMNFAASIINLTTPLTYMSYHVFQGVYADGKMATASLRAWSHDFIHASWGVFPVADGDLIGGKAFVDASLDRGLNAIQNQAGGGVTDYLQTGAGKAYAASRGYGMIVWNKYTWDNPLLSFLEDEVDAEEDNLSKNFCNTGLKLPCGASPMGILAMREIAEGETYRATYPNTPTTINMAATFKPENYYAWGQAVDVLQSDPYYQKRLKDTYWYYPERIPLYRKAYPYIYAIVKGATRAAEPNTYHVILQSTESRQIVNGVDTTWPFATPQAKRTEAYYALAGGTKGMSYWWFKPCGAVGCSNGLGDQSKQAARDVWKEMGLYGNEIKTISHLLVASHPVDVPLTPGPNVWARALAVGTDTTILLVVNDNHYNDEAGWHSTDVPNATVTMTLPAWMQPSPSAFEITAGGLYNVNTQVSGNQLQVNLGTLKVTRMIVLTKDTGLLSTLQRRYDTECRPGICNFAPELCTNIPLSIVRHPADVVLTPGMTGGFTVAAFGTRLKYQWQKNLNNLTDGGHYSGCTNATLTVSGADSNDEASYRCVVSTPHATNNSSAATLTLTTDPPAIPVANPATEVSTNSFKANWSSANGATGYRLDVSTNSGFGDYVSGYQNLDVGNVLSWNVSGLTMGPTYYYRVRAYNGNGASGNSGTISVALTVPSVCPSVGLANTDFEGGANASGVANGWIGYEVNSPTIKVWSVQNGLPAPGGSYYQQIQAYNDAHTASAGVRQNITGCVIGATYQISGWYRSNSDFGRARVRVSPNASTDWNTAVDLNPVADYGSTTNWATFSGTVVATGTNMTLWLDGRTINGTAAKVGCFDSVTITCALIAVPPSITQHPSSQSVGVGGKASFTVQVLGTEPLSYRWQKSWPDGQPFTNLNDGGHYSGATTATLTIAGADNNDAASYRCVVTNDFGSTNSTSATLTVTNVSLPPILTQQPTNQTVAAGGTASFRVLAAGSDPLSYQWQKNDTSLSNGGHYSGVTTATLTITDADDNDAGDYRCVVTNAHGSTSSSPATLTVVTPNPCLAILNSDFEEGFNLAGGGYIGDNWLEWEADPDVAIGYDETAIVHGGAHAQRIRVWGGAGGAAGGVYQRVRVTAGQPYLVGVWMSAGDSLTTCSLGVDPTGGTDPSSGVIWSSGTTNVGWVEQNLAGTAGANFITVYYRVATADDVKRNGYFDDGSPAAGSAPLQLSVRYEGPNLTLTWPECPEAVLERAVSLSAPGGWTPVTNEVTTVAGQKSVTLTPTENTGFFRLVAE